MKASYQLVLAFVLCGVTAAPSTSHAQALHSVPAAADAFRKGRDAAKRGDYLTAYTWFQSSFELDPTPGTLLNIADCEEHLGKFATAVDHFKQAAASMSEKDDRVPMIAARVLKLEPRVPRVTFSAIAGASDENVLLDDAILFASPHELTMLLGHRFTRDQHLPFDTAVRLDPGAHVARWLVTFTGAPTVDVTVSFTLAETEVRTMEPPPEVKAAAVAATQRAAEMLQASTPSQPTLSATPPVKEPGVTLHLIGDRSDGWFVKDVATGKILCDLPCVQVVAPDAYLQFGRPNQPGDIIMLPISGNRPGSALDVEPHAGSSMVPGFGIMFGGFGVGMGGALGYAAACKEGCSSAVNTTLVTTTAVGWTAFAAGLGLVLWEAFHVVPHASIEPRKSAFRREPAGRAATF